MKRKTAKGVLLIDLLMSLALMAILLAAMGAGIHAFIKSYNENDRMETITQTARSLMSQMTHDIRTADAVTASSSVVTIIPPTNTEGVTLIQYELSNGTLYCRRTVNGVAASYALLDSSSAATLKSFSLSSVMGLDSAGVSCTKSVTAKLVISVGNQVFAVTSSASPRRNQTF